MRRQRGFTMIELMTAIALGMFILYVAFAGFRAASAAMQSSQRLSIGNAMLRACLYYSFNCADGLSMHSMPVDYPDTWPVPTVKAPLHLSTKLLSCPTIQPSGARGGVFLRGHASNGGPEDYFRLTPYGRDDPTVDAEERVFEGWGHKYWCAYMNDGKISDPAFTTTAGRRLTTFRSRECTLQLIDALTGRTTSLRFRITGVTHSAVDGDQVGLSNTWIPLPEDP